MDERIDGGRNCMEEVTEFSGPDGLLFNSAAVYPRRNMVGCGARGTVCKWQRQVHWQAYGELDFIAAME